MFDGTLKRLGLEQPWYIPLYPSVGGLSREVASGFETFIKESSTEEKTRWTVDVNENGDPDLGYLDRNGKKHEDPKYEYYDNKDVFHFHPMLIDIVRKRDPRSQQHHAEWMETCVCLYHLCLKQIHQFAEQLDNELPGYHFADGVRKGDHVEKGHRNLLRINLYKPTESPNRTHLGKSHTDVCSFTLAVSESWPGLYITLNGKPPELYELSSRQGLIFAGDKVAAQTHGHIAAMRHQVKDTSGRSVRNRRWSIVFFTHHTRTTLT